MFGLSIRRDATSTDVAESSSRVSESSGFRVEDGMLIEEINELTINGGELVPSTDDTLVVFPSPDDTLAEVEVAIQNSAGASVPSPCKLDWRRNCAAPGSISQCRHSKYHKPVSIEIIKECMKASNTQDKNGGLIWKASIVPNDFDVNFKKNGQLKMCHKNNYDAENNCIKARRGNLLVKQSDFFGSLIKISNGDHYDDFELFPQSPWVFSGVLCGFPALKTLEVVTIEYKKLLSLNWKTHWSADENPNDDKPTFPGGPGLTEVRAVLRAPPYTAHGWSKSSEGYVFWFEGNGTREVPRLTYGTDIIKQFEKDRIENSKGKIPDPFPQCIKVHMISHRYATGDQSQIRDRLTYHSIALLEWDHGKYCSVVELAYLGGVAGYNGRANWLEDKMEPVNSLYKSFPPEMIQPWKANLSEIRVYDVKARNLEEHLEFMARHTGKHERFLDVKVTFSHSVRLSFCSREHIAQYLINYIRRGKTYSEMRRNCQTFAADFCAFLAGKKDVQPYHAINRVEYRNQGHYFMYKSSMYDAPRTFS